MPKIYHLRHLRPGTLHAEQWQEPSHDVSAIQRRPDTSLVVEVQVMPIHISSRGASEATELEQGVVVIGMPAALPFQNPVAPLRQAIKAHCTSVLHDQILPSPPTSDAPCIKVLVLADHKAADWLKCHHGGRKLRIWYRIGAQNSWAVCPTGRPMQPCIHSADTCRSLYN